MKQKEPFLVTADARFEFQITPETAKSIDIVPNGSEGFHLIQNGKSYKVELVAADYANRKFTVRVNGREHQAEIADKYARLIKKMGLTVGASAKQNIIKAPMPGLVLDVLVKEGQTVQEGDALVILEAMKMENVLKAANDGVIKRIGTEKGNAVDKGALLIEME